MVKKSRTGGPAKVADSMSTSSLQSSKMGSAAGFTTLELLVGMALTVVLFLGVSPLVVTIQKTGVREGDRTIAVLQGRVAEARLEKDLRLASAGGSAFPTDGPVLQATARQVVFLGHIDRLSALSIVEWEIVDGNLMRRWGPSPKSRPASFSHSLYVDNKSMLEGLAGDACFTYVVNGAVVEGTVPTDDLSFVDEVAIRGKGSDTAGVWPLAISGTARVGR